MPTSIILLPINSYKSHSVSLISNFSGKNVLLPGDDCFYLKNNELFVRANAPIGDSVIRDRLISVTVKVSW